MGNCRVTLCGVKLISIRWDESGEPVDGGQGGLGLDLLQVLGM